MKGLNIKSTASVLFKKRGKIRKNGRKEYIELYRHDELPLDEPEEWVSGGR